MKDQITILMEALRLVGIELDHFKRRRQSRDATLDAVEAIVDEPRVVMAVRSLEPLVEAPSIVPEQMQARTRVG
jgi:hypothetical protein